MTHPAHISRRARAQAAFTLAELVVSMGIMSVLLLSMSSALVIASHALPDKASAAGAQAQATAALDRMAIDLACATAITELTSTAITVTVADRGHGAAGPETIRWVWSGAAAGTLTRSYNGAPAVTVASGVSAFSLSPALTTGQLSAPPRVLMTVGSTSSPTTDEQARITKLATWAFPTTLIAASSSQSQFDAAAASCDVVYIPGVTSSYTLVLTRLLDNPGMGIVNESDGVYDQVGISISVQTTSDQKIDISDNTHTITAGLSMGAVQMMNNNQDLHALAGTIAPSPQVLCNKKGDASTHTLVLLECGATLYNNQSARGRRVVLPWGGTLFNPCPFSDLTADARTILKRSLVWAAAPSLYDRVHVSLTVGTAPPASMQVELLNHPAVPRP